MADTAINVANVFPPGTKVGAYVQAEVEAARQADRPPFGGPLDTDTVDDEGVVRFSDLLPQQSYSLYGLVGDRPTFLNIHGAVA